MLWGMVGGLAAALVSLVRDIATDRDAVFESWKYAAGWVVSMICQILVGGISARALDGNASYFLSGAAAISLLAYLISNVPDDWVK